MLSHSGLHCLRPFALRQACANRGEAPHSGNQARRRAPISSSSSVEPLGSSISHFILVTFLEVRRMSWKGFTKGVVRVSNDSPSSVDSVRLLLVVPQVCISTDGLSVGTSDCEAQVQCGRWTIAIEDHDLHCCRGLSREGRPRQKSHDWYIDSC